MTRGGRSLVGRFEDRDVRARACRDSPRDEAHLIVLELRRTMSERYKAKEYAGPTLDILTDASISSLSDME